jgi:uncharacterized membrane protein YphA (DoxX/SURF4 family)
METWTASISGTHGAARPTRHSQPALVLRHGPRALRVSIGIVFLWFGVLKFFPSVSPAEEIAIRTLRALSFDLVPGPALLLGLAVFETALGACFILGLFQRIALPLLILHMLGTATPFLLFPTELFARAFVPTFLGQYIVKNIVIVCAALVLRADGRPRDRYDVRLTGSSLLSDGEPRSV